MMRHTHRLPSTVLYSALLLPLMLGACVGFSSDRANMNNAPQIIALEKANTVSPGMSLDELTSIMGPATASGVDEDGKPYLRFVMTEQKSKATTVQIVGFIHASAYAYPVGHELQVYLEQGRVSRLARKRYVSEPGDNSK